MNKFIVKDRVIAFLPSIVFVAFVILNSSIIKGIVGIDDVFITSIIVFFYLFLSIFIGFKFYIEWSFFLLVSICFFSILINSIPSQFNSEFRYIAWLLLMIAFSPLFHNNFIGILRYQLFVLLMKSFSLITVISFFYYILGLPNLGRGHFTGIMSHSMILAPISALSCIYSSFNFFNEHSHVKKISFIIIAFLSLIVLYLCGSRSALIGCLISLFLLFVYSKARYKFIFLFFSIFLFIISSLGSFSVSNTSGVFEDRGNTRELLWLNRIIEFRSSPFIGIGFAAQTEQKILSSGRSEASESGKIEPGSGYLMVLSMTGLLGFSLFLFILVKYLIKLREELKYNSDFCFLFYILVFFCFHFIAEGYVYAFGSLMCSTFWLLLGASRFVLK